MYRSVIVLVLACLILAAQCEQAPKKAAASAAKQAKEHAKEAKETVKAAASGFDFDAIQAQAADIAKSSFAGVYKTWLTVQHEAQKHTETYADLYLEPAHAQFVKTHLFTWQGFATVVAVWILVAAIFSRLGGVDDGEGSLTSWLLSLYHSRAFFTTASFGVLLTLLVLTRLTGVDPLTLVAKASKANAQNIVHLTTAVSIWIVLLNFLSVFKHGLLNFVSFLLSAGLFAEAFGLHPHLEAFTGPIAKYVFPVILLGILSFLSFSQLIPHDHHHHELLTPKFEYVGKSEDVHEKSSKQNTPKETKKVK